MLKGEEVRTLVERARVGDPDAWEALYRHAYPRLHTYARRRLVAQHQVDDAVSETMARAIDHIDRFTWGRAGFDGWLFGILRNVVLEAYRTAARHPVADPRRVDDAAVDEEPAARLIADADAAALRDAFAQLDAADQELLELRVVARLPADAVAEVVGRRPGAVRTAQSRAMSKLRTLLGGPR